MVPYMIRRMRVREHDCTSLSEQGISTVLELFYQETPTFSICGINIEIYNIKSIKWKKNLWTLRKLNSLPHISLGN